MRLMKMAAIALLVGPMCAVSPKLYAAELNSSEVAQKIVSQDSGAKAQIKEDKQKIAEERDGILAAGRRLDKVRKLDKAQVEQVKKEVDEEIKQRKARISALKDNIEQIQQGRESIAPGRKSRAKEGK